MIFKKITFSAIFHSFKHFVIRKTYRNMLKYLPKFKEFQTFTFAS